MSQDVVMNQLLDLRLSGIRSTIAARLTQARKGSVGYEDFLSLLLQDEVDHRKSMRVKRLLSRAQLRGLASLETVDYSAPRGLDKKVLGDLATCRFILDGANLIIMGPTGVGKTHLASAIGNNACRAGYSTLFFRMNALLEQLLLARAKANYLNFIKKLASCDLLIIDDFGIKPLEPKQYQDLYDVLDERGEDKAVIITTQLPVENWSEVIPDAVTCEAITDRLAAVATRIVMKGDSYRPKRNTNRKKP